MKGLKIQCACAQILFEMSMQLYHNVINDDAMIIIEIKIIISRNNI